VVGAYGLANHLVLFHDVCRVLGWPGSYKNQVLTFLTVELGAWRTKVVLVIEEIIRGVLYYMAGLMLRPRSANRRDFRRTGDLAGFRHADRLEHDTYQDNKPSHE
jgi:hypothetical protein